MSRVVVAAFRFAAGRSSVVRPEILWKSVHKSESLFYQKSDPRSTFASVGSELGGEKDGGPASSIPVSSTNMNAPPPHAPLKKEENTTTPATKARATGLHREISVKGPLALFMGKNLCSRIDVTKAIWKYIKQNNLQKPVDKRIIRCDSTLKSMTGKDEVTMFEIPRQVNQFFDSPPPGPKKNPAATKST